MSEWCGEKGKSGNGKWQKSNAVIIFYYFSPWEINFTFAGCCYRCCCCCCWPLQQLIMWWWGVGICVCAPHLNEKRWRECLLLKRGTAAARERERDRERCANLKSLVASFLCNNTLCVALFLSLCIFSWCEEIIMEVISLRLVGSLEIRDNAEWSVPSRLLYWFSARAAKLINNFIIMGFHPFVKLVFKVL